MAYRAADHLRATDHQMAKAGPAILFYISGHGWGHATRTAALWQEMAAQAPNAAFHVRTMAPEWVFQMPGLPPVRYQQVQIDAGIVEAGLLGQDIPATYARACAVEAQRESIIAREVEYVRQAGIDIIVSDIPPLASEVGAICGVPVVAVGNFSWDYIYAGFLPLEPGFRPLIDSLRRSYAHTAMLLRLPFCHEMDAFPCQQDVPLLARRPATSRESILADLGYSPDDDTPVVLIALRQREVPETAVRELVADRHLRVLSYSQLPGEVGGGVRVLSGSWQQRFVDVLSISDVVVAKLGYSIVAECVAWRTRIAWAPRSHWAEQPFLAEGARQYVPMGEMKPEEFAAGHWKRHVDDLLATPFPEARADASGARVAAERILSLCPVLPRSLSS